MPRATKSNKPASVEKTVFNNVIEGFSSGYGMIDIVSGVPGVLFPRATIAELFGLKSASKTTVVLETIAYNQMINPDFKVLYVDFEKMLRNEYDYIRKLGVDVDSDNFEVISPDTMEEGTKVIQERVKANSVDMIVVDTVAAMRPKEEKDGGLYENKQFAVRAKKMSEFLRQIMADMPSNGPAVIFINQLYKDITAKTSFVQLYKTPSSDTLAFYAGIRIEVKSLTKIKDKKVNVYTLEEEEIPIGQITQISTEKNKVGMPFLKSKYMITYGMGVDVIPSMISAAIKSGAIYFKGASKGTFLFKVDGEEQKPITGMNRLIHYFRNNLDVAKAVGEQINEYWAKEMETFIPHIQRKMAAMSEVERQDVYAVEDGEEEDNHIPSNIDPETGEILEEEETSTLQDIFSKGKKVKKIDDVEEESQEVVEEENKEAVEELTEEHEQSEEDVKVTSNKKGKLKLKLSKVKI